QARIRMKLGFPVLLFVVLALWYWGSVSTRIGQREIAFFSVLYSLYNFAAYFFSMRMRPFSQRQLVLATAILDPLLLSCALCLLDEAGALLICFYLFTILGFGFRIGPKPMWLCQATSLLGFICVTAIAPLWWNHPVMTISNFILLLVVPMYATVLIKKLRDALASAEHESQAKSQLLANVSHELRTPLTGILSSAQLMKEEARDMAVTRRSDTILRLAKDLMSEIDNLLDSEKYAANALKIDSVGFHLRDVVEHLRITLSPTAVAKGIALSIYMDERIRQAVEGDAHYLTRVLMNIGGNAVKFTEQGKVDISLIMLSDDREAYTLRFSCQDTGIGIPVQMHQKIFDRFFQVSGGTTRKYGGTGLGMSIASEIVSLMGGKLRLESEPGKGSLFSFDVRLPKVRDHSAESAPAKDIPRVHGKNILVADDNNTILLLIKELLERDQHVVTTARSGKAAVDLLSTMSFDLVILDYNMGDIDGATVLQLYRFGKVKPAPTYILTADTTVATAEKLKECGAEGILHKPISSEVMRAAIANVFPASAAVPRPASHDIRHRTASRSRDYIDGQAIEDLKEINAEASFLSQVLSTAVSDIEYSCRLLLIAIDHGELKDVREHAHALKGVCLSVGAMRLADLASKLMAMSPEVLRRDKAQSKKEFAAISAGSVAALRSILLSAPA
ncbi:MAG: response regulator, partial [Herminiimonas sp.]|nr:response regulator [Herminiimonas sp.]